MAVALFVISTLAALSGAGFAVLAGTTTTRRRGGVFLLAGLALMMLAAGADLMAFVIAAGGLAVTLVLATAVDPWLRQPSRRRDARVLPAALAAVGFAVLYSVVVRSAWPQTDDVQALARTAVIGARLLTSDLAALIVTMLLVAGAVTGAARLAAGARADEVRD